MNRIAVIGIIVEEPQEVEKLNRQNRKTGRNLGKSSLLEIGDMHEQRHTE